MTTQKKIPLFIGEWGVPNATANGAQYQAQMLKLFKLDGIGSARWFMWPSNDSGGLTLLALDNTFTPLATQLAQAWAGS
jgi:hypothetical protein